MKRCFKFFSLALFLALPVFGEGVAASDDELAVKAEGGDRTSQYLMGCRYFHGSDDEDRDYLVAAKWLQMAAAAGHVEAQSLLGYMYVAAYGVSPDVEKGLALLRRAAEEDDRQAQYYLGTFYETGRGVVPDRFEAMDWYMKAADQGDEAAKQSLIRLRTGADAARRREASSTEWWQVSIEELTEKAGQGDVKAQRSLGFRYEGFGGTAIDIDQARYWYEQAASQTNARSHYSLSQLYVRTTNVLPEKAFYHCSVAAEEGYPLACRILGRYYRDGFGTAPDRAQALRWFMQAEKVGDAKGASSAYSLIKGSAEFTGQRKGSRSSARDYSPLGVELKIRDVENEERTIRFVKYDPETEMVQTDYRYDSSYKLPLAAFHKDSHPVIWNEASHEAFERLTVRISEKKLSRDECERAGKVRGEVGATDYDYDGFAYTLEFRNRGDMTLTDLDVDCRFYYEKEEEWRAMKRQKKSNILHETYSCKIQKLSPDSTAEVETSAFVLESYDLPSGMYYIGGKAEVVKSQPEGLWVRVSQKTADGVTVYRDFCDPSSLSSKMSWR